jgi:hypothetical protein
MTELEKYLESLKQALKAGSISVNEYSTFYYNACQKAKK